MKKILTLLMGIFGLSFMFSMPCSAARLSDSDVAESIPEAMKQIMIDETYYELDVESIEINERYRDENYDTVYCTIVLENEYYRNTSEYTLYYGFYDSTGWVLDNWSKDSFYTEALAAPEQELTDWEMDYYYFDSYAFKESSFESEWQYAECEYEVSYESDHYSYNGTVTMVCNFYSYYSGGYWEKYIEYNDNFDWHIINTWAAGNDELDSGNRFGNSAVEVEILSVDQENGEVEVSATAYFKDNVDVTGGTVTATMVFDYTGEDYLAGGGRYKIVPDEAELEEMKYDVPTLSFAFDIGRTGCTMRIMPYDAQVTLSGSGNAFGDIYRGYEIYSWEDPEYGYVYCEKRPSGGGYIPGPARIED